MAGADPETVVVADPLVGQVLSGRYQVEGLLGEGAMGSVYKARHVKLGRLFAVKVLHARLLENEKILQRFQREAELAGRLRHPNVIGVVDVGETPAGNHYMVMELATGQDLATLIGDAPMPRERVVHLTRQLLEGLYHAHEQGLIHRDFKPENVMVERDDHGTEVARIVDFGIAILREGDDGDTRSSGGRLTTAGLVLGTPHYMAPEQAVDDALDHRVDLFALGIAVYEMLSGRLPFDGSGVDVARANLLLEPPAIAERVPWLEVDPLLEAFARRLMAKKRDHRPATAKAARELLDLIERDRLAAAELLGVKLASTTFEPAVTAPVAAQPPAALEAPPVATSALGDTTPSPAHEVSTDELEAARPRRRLWMVAAIGGIAAAGIVAFVLSRRGGEPEREPAPIATPAPVDAAVAKIEPAPAPPAEPPKPAPEPEPAKVEPVPAKVTPTPTPTPKPPIATTTKKPPVTTPPAVTTTKPPPAAAVLDAPAIYELWREIGRDLKRVAAERGATAVEKIENRFRLLGYPDTSTEAKRAAATATLRSLRAELARLR